MKKKQVINVSSKPVKCPHCGGEVVNIIYGFPIHEPKGKYILGGCNIYPGMPDWECLKCHQQFRKGSKE